MYYHTSAFYASLPPSLLFLLFPPFILLNCAERAAGGRQLRRHLSANSPKLSSLSPSFSTPCRIRDGRGPGPGRVSLPELFPLSALPLAFAIWRGAQQKT